MSFNLHLPSSPRHLVTSSPRLPVPPSPRQASVVTLNRNGIPIPQLLFKLLFDRFN